MSLPTLFRPLSTPLLVIALGLPGTVWAEDASQRRFDVPAGSLASALTRFAGQAGVSLSVDPALVAGRSSTGLRGDFAVEEGFQTLLQGSGLQLVPAGQGSYTLMRQAQPADDAHELPSTTINGEGVGLASDAYAGGQVARRGNQGLLGERDFMETPFNMTSYTSEALQNQQARTLADAVANDPSVRTTNPSGGRFEQFSVRGFSLYNSDVAYGAVWRAADLLDRHGNGRAGGHSQRPRRLARRPGAQRQRGRGGEHRTQARG